MRKESRWCELLVLLANVFQTCLSLIMPHKLSLKFWHFNFHFHFLPFSFQERITPTQRRNTLDFITVNNPSSIPLPSPKPTCVYINGIWSFIPFISCMCSDTSTCQHLQNGTRFSFVNILTELSSYEIIVLWTIASLDEIGWQCQAVVSCSPFNCYSLTWSKH